MQRRLPLSRKKVKGDKFKRRSANLNVKYSLMLTILSSTTSASSAFAIPPRKMEMNLRIENNHYPKDMSHE